MLSGKTILQEEDGEGGRGRGRGEEKKKERKRSINWLAGTSNIIVK